VNKEARKEVDKEVDKEVNKKVETVSLEGNRISRMLIKKWLI